MKLRQQLESEKLIGKKLRTQLEGLEFDLYLRARELQQANDKLRHALLEAGREGMESFSVWRYIEVFEHLLYCVPGDVVPRSGIYELVHSDRFGGGCYESKVVLRLGERFPVCHYCGTRVRYRLLYPGFARVSTNQPRTL